MKNNFNVKKLVVGAFKTNCYIVTLNKNIYIIDPGACYETIKEKIIETKLQIKYILLTHGHIDHISCAQLISDTFQCPIFLNNDDKTILDKQSIFFKPFYPDISSKEFANSIDKIQDKEITLIYIPGHTMGGTCFYFKNYNTLFSGDTLFYETIGKTDLPNSNHSILINSIKKYILTLPENTIIYPGHGKCTTVEHEKLYNYYLK